MLVSTSLVFSCLLFCFLLLFFVAPELGHAARWAGAVQARRRGRDVRAVGDGQEYRGDRSCNAEARQEDNGEFRRFQRGQFTPVR